MKYGVSTCIFALFLFVSTLPQMVRPTFAEEPTITLEGSRPNGADLSKLEPAPPDMIIPHIRMNFAIQNPTEFKQLLEDQQNPASPNFNKEFTPQQLHARFGESESQFSEVKNWLLQQHFLIVDETYGRASDFIAFSGTIAQIEAAFHVRIVWDKSTGRYANLDAPQIPARFSGLIRGLVGIYNTGGGQMLLQRSGQSTPNIIIGPETGFAPQDVYTFYNETPLITAGITGDSTHCIAVLALSDFADSSVNLFDSTFNLPAPTPNPILRVPSGGPNPGEIAPYETEVLTDIEWAHAIAPSAPIKVYIGNNYVIGNDAAITDALQGAVNANSCGSIVMSYGNCDSVYDQINFSPLFTQAANQHQSVYVAAGDTGAAGLAMLPNGTCVPGTSQNVNEISADPNVTSVGGTQFTPSMPAPSYADVGFVAESVWDELTGATGGGVSSIFPQPSWQTGLGVPVGGNRDVPDVAMLGSSDMPGAFIVDDVLGADVFERIGGTSLGAPIWAGIGNLLSQKNAAKVGNINPRLYQMGPQGIGMGFRDVQIGDNHFNGVLGFPAGPGYDEATGWGTPNISKFVSNFVSTKVLVSGGTSNDSTPEPTAQTYDYSSGTFTTTTGNLNRARYAHTQTLLNDGRVLIAGGSVAAGITAAAELYNPATKTFTVTGSMKKARFYHQATLLEDGTVLITGGSGVTGSETTAEIYAPSTGIFTLLTNTMNDTRADHRAVLLNDGRVLIVGGETATGIGISSAEIYDPIQKTFVPVGSMNAKRGGPTATLLPSGKVLVAGGYVNATCCTGELATAELFDPFAETFSYTTGQMSTQRVYHATALLDNGQVLVAGGQSNGTANNATLATAEVYDPGSNAFVPTGSMTHVRDILVASMLPNGKVLVAGGQGNVLPALNTADVYTPAANPAAGAFAPTGIMNRKAAFAAASGSQ